MILADKIINHRKRLNLTQEQLAGKAHFQFLIPISF